MVKSLFAVLLLSATAGCRRRAGLQGYRAVQARCGALLRTWRRHAQHEQSAALWRDAGRDQPPGRRAVPRWCCAATASSDPSDGADTGMQAPALRRGFSFAAAPALRRGSSIRQKSAARAAAAGRDGAEHRQRYRGQTVGTDRLGAGRREVDDPPCKKGPRSLIRTITERPVLRFLTSTKVPNGNVRWAAVNRDRRHIPRWRFSRCCRLMQFQSVVPLRSGEVMVINVIKGIVRQISVPRTCIPKPHMLWMMYRARINRWSMRPILRIIWLLCDAAINEYNVAEICN